MHDQAFMVGTALAMFDAEHPWRYLERELQVEARDLPAIVERYLQPASSGVLGWSLPAD